jgi:hypothetical protein
MRRSKREREVLDLFGKKSEPTQPSPPHSSKKIFPIVTPVPFHPFLHLIISKKPQVQPTTKQNQRKKIKLHNYGATSILIGPDVRMDEGVAVLLVLGGGVVLNVGGGGIVVAVVVVVVVIKSEQEQVKDVFNEKVVKVSLSSLSNCGMEEDDTAIFVRSVNIKGERVR